ncbi:predicted protein [Cyanophage PSS2]|uniref:hypothetical protein n=1 Tax=Cyanophage PSS2 TaxID=658401 RepID=UPI0001B04003|nr:hypothetical protein PSS2_gp046 [Cyanophage PSS2]ACT65608.1 hypothetical protein [Cyanophage PSS2]ACY75751.1 predicted protein [Cyanophage PSS2]
MKEPIELNDETVDALVNLINVLSDNHHDAHKLCIFGEFPYHLLDAAEELGVEGRLKRNWLHKGAP